MIKNIVLFILNADGSYKVAPIGTIRANSRNSCLIGVLAPTPHDNIVQVGYSIQDSVDIQVSQFLDLSSQKGADIISPQASYYDDVKEWHYWESNITPQALSYVSKHRGGKTGVSITISEREIPKEATNYKGLFGYQPLPPTANNGDFYECDKNDTVAFGYTFAKGDIAFYLNGWQQSRLYAIMTTSTEPIPVAPNISVGAVGEVDDLTPVYERLGEQQAQINNNTSSVGFLRDSVDAIEEDIDNLQEKDNLLQGQINDLSNSTDERFDEVNETLDSIDNTLVEHRNDIDTNKGDIVALKTEQTTQNNRLTNVETKATNNQNDITTLNSTKLNKVWSDIASQTEILLTDLVVINRNNTAFKTTIQSMLSKVAIPELFIVVEELPSEPERNRIYLVSDGKGAFNEYIFINDAWENLGSIEVDLTNYYTRAEIDTMLNLYLTGNEFNLFKALNDSKLTQLTTDLATTQTDLTNHKNNQNNPHAVNKAQVGLGNVDNTSDLNKPVSTATQTALGLKANQTDLAAHAGNTNNPHAVTKAQVGLGNVDNTSDLNKPVSNATQTALGLKANASDIADKKLRTFYSYTQFPNYTGASPIVNGDLVTTLSNIYNMIKYDGDNAIYIPSATEINQFVVAGIMPLSNQESVLIFHKARWNMTVQFTYAMSGTQRTFLTSWNGQSGSVGWKEIATTDKVLSLNAIVSDANRDNLPFGAFWISGDASKGFPVNEYLRVEKKQIADQPNSNYYVIEIQTAFNNSTGYCRRWIGTKTGGSWNGWKELGAKPTLTLLGTLANASSSIPYGGYDFIVAKMTSYSQSVVCYPVASVSVAYDLQRWDYVGGEVIMVDSMSIGLSGLDKTVTMLLNKGTFKNVTIYGGKY